MWQPKSSLHALIFVLLVFAHLVWAGMTFAQSGQGNPFWELMSDSLPFAQAGLLSLLLVVGTGRPRLRILCGAACLFWIVGSGLTLWRTENVLAWQILAVECSAILLFGATLRWSRRGLRRGDNDAAVPGLQFSIRGLMFATISTGLMVAGGRTVRGLTATREIVPEWLIAVLMGSTLALALCLATWAFLRRGTVFLRLFLFSAVLVALGLAIPFVVWRQADTRACLMWLLVHGTVVSATLLTIRACGFRMMPPMPEAKKGVVNRIPAGSGLRAVPAQAGEFSFEVGQ